MTRPVILAVSPDHDILARRQALARSRGWWTLGAGGVQRALSLLRKVRPTVVLADADLPDGRIADLLAQMRAVPPLANVPVIVLGSLALGDRRAVERDPYAHRGEGALSWMLAVTGLDGEFADPASTSHAPTTRRRARKRAS